MLQGSIIRGVAVGAGYVMLAMASTGAGAQTAKGSTYEANWESLKQHATPEWFRDAKFGIYFHWGIYSVPAFGSEWYSRNMYVKGSVENLYHLQHYGKLDTFGYKDFIPMFKAEKWDPDAWAKLFKQAGAKYAGPVAEHADGFSMWDSKLTKWNAARMGPKRDVVGEMARAIRKQGLKFYTSFHHQWLWGWYPTMDRTTDTADPRYSGLYGPPNPPSAWDYGNPVPPPDAAFSAMWRDKVKEVIDRYRPDIIYFDSRMKIIPESYRQELLAYYYNKGREWRKEVGMTYKGDDLPAGVAIEDLERGRMGGLAPVPWMTDDAIDWNSWSDVQNPSYKTTKRLVDMLVDIVSKNGCFILDITPKADGTIPEAVKERLLQIGAWLKTNGEAIYGTRPWRIYGEGPTSTAGGAFNEQKIPDLTAADVRFTTKGRTLYAIVMGWPEGGKAVIPSLAEGQEPQAIRSVELLGSREKLAWTRSAEGLTVTLPTTKPCDYAFVLRIR